jgi:hypothetical protein
MALSTTQPLYQPDSFVIKATILSASWKHLSGNRLSRKAQNKRHEGQPFFLA